MDRSVSRPLRKRRLHPHRGWVKWLWSHPTCRSKESSTRSVSACVLHDDASGETSVLDFLAVLFGYAISGERTLQDFYTTVQPFASVFMAMFGRTRFPAASTLSRFLAALPAEPVEALRNLFLEDLLGRADCPLKSRTPGCGIGRETARWSSM